MGSQGSPSNSASRHDHLVIRVDFYVLVSGEEEVLARDGDIEHVRQHLAYDEPWPGSRIDPIERYSSLS